MTTEPEPQNEAPETDEELNEQADADFADDGTDLPEAEPEARAPRQTLSQADVERRMAQLEREGERHAKRVAEIMGEDAGLLIPSPIDWTPGFLFDPSMMPVDPQALAALDALLGRGNLDTFPVDETKERCDACDGWGKLRTGSRVENQDALPCWKCSGQGWKGRLHEAPQPAQPHPGFNVTTSGPFPPNQPVAADQWGRPFGHPHYGLDPASVTA